MQLSPSADFYDDYNEDDDSLYLNYGGDDDDDDEDEDGDEPESLPEAKELVQSPNVKSNAEEEEEDMGYDEDDERIAIAVERPKELRPQHDNDKGFMNEEGSGGYGRSALLRYKDNVNENRFRLGHIEKFRKKQQKLLPESANRDEVDSREGSGNFASDDENDDDDDDDGSEDYADSDGFFNSKRSKSGGRYFRKNASDAIKIISTPLGKVGIVYQQTPAQGEEKKGDDATDKKATTFTDFDALSPDPESSHRLTSSHPKITPVLTPDGKVALLYRGDSESSKYEPIRNLTHKFNNKNEATDNKASATSVEDTKLVSLDTDRSYDESADSEDADDTSRNSEGDDDKSFDVNDNINRADRNDNVPDPAAPFPALTPTSGTFIVRPTDTVLPMINRPLSEVLGIKKNQFKQFRIKDIPTTEATPRSLAGIAADHSDATTLHFLTKVNLADYPTSARTRNRDFDFSRDNTMLDERTRHREHQTQTPAGEPGDGKVNTVANEEVLSKTEVVNLAIIPHFDEELERLQHLREHENRRHHRQRHRQKQTEEDLSGIHCVMQAMMGIAAISTVFGMLGTFFKQRILDQIRLMHW